MHKTTLSQNNTETQQKEMLPISWLGKTNLVLNVAHAFICLFLTAPYFVRNHSFTFLINSKIIPY